ncbi:MAG: DUF4198 domain-containing protein [Wolinella sp.]
MRRTIPILALATLPLFAHNLFSVGKNEGGKFKAEMIYGHNFPIPEAIAPERLSIFEPMSIIGKEGKVVLNNSKGGESYNFEGKTLKKGSYILLATYKPTAWVKQTDGKWHMRKTRKDLSDVEYCGVTTMLGKAIVHIDGSSDDFVTKPLGKGLEIVPMSSTIKVDTTVKFKILRDGKPLKQAKIFGSFGGYATSEMSQAFYAMSDLNGEFEFKALKAGLWYLKSTVDTDSGDKDCEINNDHTTLSFMVE